MRALVLDGGVRLDRRYPNPEPKEDEALIKPILAGVCDTDLELAKGYMGFSGVLGHEFVGRVVSAPDETLVGKRVVGEINIPCGRCRMCREELENHCPRRTVLGILGKDGAFADYLTLPVKNLHVVPGSVRDEDAVFTEPLAAAFQVLEQVEITLESRVAVVGDGKLGLLVAQALGQTGLTPLVIGHHREKLAILARLGIDTRLEDDVRDIVSEFDVVVDATGAPSGLKRAMELVKPRGTIVLKTTVAERGGVDLNRLVIDEVTLVGSRCGPFGRALEALETGEVDTSPLISEIVSIEEGEAAMEKAAGALKILLSFI